MKKYILLFIIILFSQNILNAKTLEKVSLQLQWLDQFQFGINISQDVQNNISTYGIGRSSLIINRSNGANIKLLSAIFQSSPFVLIAREDSSIRSIKDFVGKRVMITPELASMVSLYAMENKFGVSSKDMIEQKHTFNLKRV